MKQSRLFDWTQRVKTETNNTHRSFLKMCTFFGSPYNWPLDGWLLTGYTVMWLFKSSGCTTQTIDEWVDSAFCTLNSPVELLKLICPHLCLTVCSDALTLLISLESAQLAGEAGKCGLINQSRHVGRLCSWQECSCKHGPGCGHAGEI